MFKEKQESNKLKDWSSRYMRMRTELVLFSIILLFMAIFGTEKIENINLVFAKFSIDFEKDKIIINTIIIVLWSYLFVAVLARWLLERGKNTSSRQLILESHSFLKVIKKRLYSPKETKEFNENHLSIKNDIDRSIEAIKTLKSEEGCLKSQELIIKKAINASKINCEELNENAQHYYTSVVNQIERTLSELVRVNEDRNRDVVHEIATAERITTNEIEQLSSTLDALYSTQKEIDKKFEEYKDTLNLMVRKEKWAAKGEFIDKSFFGIFVPIVFSVIALLSYLFLPKNYIAEYFNSEELEVTTQQKDYKTKPLSTPAPPENLPSKSH